jgi:thiol reductant ABC exporter CydC subunit
VLSAGCAIGLLATSGWLLTRSSQRPAVLGLAVAIGAVQAFALGRGATRYLQRLAVHGLALETLSRLRLWLYDTVEPLVPDGLRGQRGGPPSQVTVSTGSVLSGFVADTEETSEALARSTTTAIDLASSVVLGAAVAALLVPSGAAALLAAAAVLVGVASAAVHLGRPAAGRAAASRAELAEQVVEALRSAPELLAFGRQDLVEERLEATRRRARGSARRQAAGIGAARALVTWAAGAGVIAVVLAGLTAHRSGQLSGIGLTVLVLVALAALDQGAALPAALAGRAGGDAAAARLARLAGLEPPAREPDRDAGPPAGPVGAALDRVEVTAGGPGQGVVILHDVSLVVAPGGRVALTGPSGAGKSTAVHVLLHFLEPSGGSASVGGVDVRRMTREGLACHVAWLDEETHLFAASVADNLRLARPDATAAECADALDRVGLGAWLGSLPDGLGTVLGAGGRPTSAGERQRLGMARALLSGAGLLLLDEPTAHLDPWSSAAVLRELLGATGARSVLVVSHEPDVAGEVDLLVTLESGRVVAREPAD